VTVWSQMSDMPTFRNTLPLPFSKAVLVGRILPTYTAFEDGTDRVFRTTYL